MTTDVSDDTKQQSSLALELTEMGLSLFVCQGDVPIECIAHVDLDDPDFSKKLSAFRDAAEASAGKGFETQIWLPDEQVMYRSLKLDDEDLSDPREAATSALSASTPFQGTTLSFDLGDTNGAGYTPVAAIPKEKMDEAMAFAKKMRLNPSLITTSNVVAGFSSRPEFKEFKPESVKRPVSVRVAALAMMLAAPIFLLSSEIDRVPGIESDAGQAFVATIEAIDADYEVVQGLSNQPTVVSDLDETLPSTLETVQVSHKTPTLGEPAMLGTPNLNLGRRGPHIQWTELDLGAGHQIHVETVSEVALPIAQAVVEPFDVPVLDYPETNLAKSAEILAQFMVFQPAYVSVLTEEIQTSTETGRHSIVTNTPVAVFEPGPDDAPLVDMLAVEYVQNVFDGNIEIHDLMAIDEVASDAFSSLENPMDLVRLANFGADVLVRRPQIRSAPKLVQPAFMPRPEKRPLPPLPEKAFDINSLQSIKPEFAIEDPPPNLVIEQSDLSPIKDSPLGLVFRLDEGTAKIIDLVTAQKRKTAVSDARANLSGQMANLISPRARDAVPLAGSRGAIVQNRVTLNTFTSLPVATAILEIPRNEQRVSVSISGPSPFAQVQRETRFVLSPRISERTTAVVRNIIPYDPRRAENQREITFTEAAARQSIPRPPSRRRQVTASISPEGIRAMRLDSESSGLDASIAGVIADRSSIEDETVNEISVEKAGRNSGQSSEIDASSQTDLAAAALPKLLLPRPPVRPERSTNIAALIETLEPASNPSGPISKFAIESLYSPAKRPPGLEAQAKKTIELRNSVSHQVAIKQEPVPTTPRERLRIPTGARVGATATIKDGIALGDLSLIGIYGTTKTRRALVRLPQGRYVQISRGDRVSGWTVSAVSEDAVRIQKGSKNMVLRLPN